MLGHVLVDSPDSLTDCRVIDSSKEHTNLAQRERSLLPQKPDRNVPRFGSMRWLTVHFPEQPDIVLVLMEPGPPAYDDATAAEIRELVAKGAAGGGLIFETDDCQGTYESLKAAGVEFTQEPTERFYGIDCGLRDPFGNPIRFTQPPEGPIVVPSPEELEAQA